MIQRTLWCLLISAVGMSNSAAIAGPNELTNEEKQQGFELLFDGKSLDGWKPRDPKRFRADKGMLIAHGNGRSMVYYVGRDGKADYRDFELRLQVRTSPRGNSGVYFRTRDEEDSTGFPNGWGYEAQILNTHRVPKKTGSITRLRDVNPSPAKDGEWFDYHIIANGRQITIKVNGKVVNEVTEPADASKRRRTGGLIGLQAHDPGFVQFRTIRIRNLK